MDISATRIEGSGTGIVGEILAEFRNQKGIADRALAQLGDSDLFHAFDSESNTLAEILKHVGGNLISRWTDFLTTDGEKEWRDRDGEFEAREDSAEDLRAVWERGWGVAIGEIGALTDADLDREVFIRGQSHTVHRALTRSLAHSAHHVGQIVWLAKHLKGAEWRTLSMPKRRVEASSSG